jgi:hypothetical protein
MKERKVKIGVTATRRTVSKREIAGEQETLIEAKLRKWGVDYAGLDWPNGLDLGERRTQ